MARDGVTQSHQIPLEPGAQLRHRPSTSRHLQAAAAAAALALILPSCGEREDGDPAEREAPERVGAADAVVANDFDLAARVQAAIAADRDLRLKDVDVEVDGGGITLRGAVKSGEDRERATLLVLAVSGVRWVKNDLSVGRDS